ncbi:hypothetical protein JAAARDRAFT_29217 [Jaapia argillacea MUCL 33604]|uniref:Uncharacterized protein n=1 Tax=Jaapia argillacea MUCL 33604 TaxID=933084 RepID=A0A067QI54_9AGAM|nr:hypothetical protein JAAARDRAFT_29217 [Jaapia argillacea MUCL 33604]
MSERTARMHTNVSNRAKAKQSLERKVVFKSVLDNPFHIQWPSVPMNVQNSILASIVSMAEGVAAYHQLRESQSRTRKRARRVAKLGSGGGEPSAKKRRPSNEEPSNMDIDSPQTTLEGADPHAGIQNLNEPEDTVTLAPPPILHHLIFGINEVTKRLESQVRANRQTIVFSNKETTVTELSPIRLILVCRADVDPPMLVGHIPHLVASCNSAIRGRGSSGAHQDSIRLVPLPKGSEFILSEAIGLRRVSILAVDAAAPGLAALEALLGSVPVLSASWLTPQSLSAPQERTLEPTHIKQLRTSAPKDVKAAKQLRAEAKKAAKERNTLKKQTVRKRVKIVASDSNPS